AVTPWSLRRPTERRSGREVRGFSVCRRRERSQDRRNVSFLLTLTVLHATVPPGTRGSSARGWASPDAVWDTAGSPAAWRGKIVRDCVALAPFFYSFIGSPQAFGRGWAVS